MSAVDREITAAKPNPNNITFFRRLPHLGLNHALFEWADSYDAKDWERLSKCIAPTLRVGPFPQPEREN